MSKGIHNNKQEKRAPFDDGTSPSLPIPISHQSNIKSPKPKPRSQPFACDDVPIKPLLHSFRPDKRNGIYVYPSIEIYTSKTRRPRRNREEKRRRLYNNQAKSPYVIAALGSLSFGAFALPPKNLLKLIPLPLFLSSAFAGTAPPFDIELRMLRTLPLAFGLAELVLLVLTSLGLTGGPVAPPLSDFIAGERFSVPGVVTVRVGLSVVLRPLVAEGVEGDSVERVGGGARLGETVRWTRLGETVRWVRVSVVVVGDVLWLLVGEAVSLSRRVEAVE
jgi:hypothetical protein